MKNNEDIQSIQKDVDDRISKYYGKKVSELKERLGIKIDNKASFVQLSKKMLKIPSNQFELCDGRVNAVLKTVRLTGTNTPAESMSFMNIDFKEWVDSPDWYASSLYRYFHDKVLVFFIFQQYPSGKRVADDEMTFLKAKAWKMPDYDLEHGLKEVWDEVRDLLKNNRLEIKAVTQKNGRQVNKNNLPSMNFNELGHLRPGAKNGEDKVTLPDGQRIVRQRFWFNSSYVKEILGI